MKDNLFTLLQHLIPQHLLSRFLGYLAASSVSWIKDLLIQLFIKHFKVNMHEAANPDPTSYSCFNDFFTRPLRSDARPIVLEPTHLACPADGCISQLGDIHHDLIFQAKGHMYSLTTLIGGNHELAKPFISGTFATIYLSPKDYHRVHMPLDGTLRSMVHVPGRLFSVNQATSAKVPGLFACNERVVAIFDTAVGPLCMVLVGAMVVASISTVWAGTVCPPRRQITTTNYQDRSSINLKKGAQMGHFQLGSTVILCLPPGVNKWPKELYAGAAIQQGQLFGYLNQSKIAGNTDKASA